MKQLSGFNKLVYVANIILAMATFLGYALPFLAPKAFPVLAVLTLGLPVLFTLNILFFCYWIFQLKKYFLLSAIVLLIGIGFINKWIRFSDKDIPEAEGDVKIVSYNVRRFNQYEWLGKKDVITDMTVFFQEQDPDILCIQENAKNDSKYLQQFPYKYVPEENNGNAIYSKYPIIDNGQVRFENSGNNFVFADIVLPQDTLRVYSMHLQSIQITKDVRALEDQKALSQEKSELIVRKISRAFRKQQEQATLITEHRQASPYASLVCGDLNNSAFSYTYRTVRGELNDAFEQAGKGFGKSYMFKYFPFRIDFIFVDPQYQIKEFKTFNTIDLSDHYPIMARIGKLEEEN